MSTDEVDIKNLHFKPDFDSLPNLRRHESVRQIHVIVVINQE